MSGAGDELIVLKNRNPSNRQRVYSGIPTDEHNDCRVEKSWQRVPSPFIIILLGLYLLLGFLTQLIEDDMPRVIPEADIDRYDWETFSEEAANRYLTEILGGKPRVAGAAFHLEKTKDLFDLVNNVASQGRLPVRTDWQIASGDYLLNFSVPFVNYYQNVSNIIALIEGETGFQSDGSLGPSLLVNCHYDSVPFAEGASDNGVFCAVLVEVLSRLSRRPTKFKHNILLLFNGAEENPLQGSHAFLQHPWAKSVTTMINLDAAGMNGKPSVFQVTDARILSAYQSGTYRPSAQAVGEFLFMTGIIPSDTDFRIFRDFGNIQGIDIAFTKWGVVYHTANDKQELILPGVIQNAGNMLLRVITIAADEDLQEKIPTSRMVYFDFLNVFMVAYTYTVSYILDVLVALFALLSVAYYIWLIGPRWSTVQELLWALAGRVCCLLGGLLLGGVLVVIMVSTTVQLRYLSQPWIVVPMFWLPYIIGTVAVSHVFDWWRTQKSGLNRSIRTLQAMAATRLLIAVILLVMACVPVLTTIRYVVAVPLFIMSLSSIVSMTVIRYVKLQGWQHLIVEFLLSVPSCMFMFVLALRLDAMMLPIMARSALDQPDYVVALINIVLAVVSCVAISGIELLFSRKWLWAPLSAVLVGSMVCMFVPFLPYQRDGIATQRHYWLHSDIKSYNERHEQTSHISGVFVTKMDVYSTQMLPFLEDMGVPVKNFTGYCDSRVYCGMPVYRVSMGRVASEGLFVFADPPAPFAREPNVTAARTCVGDLCTYNFEVVVTPHNLLALWPRPNVTVTSWTLQSPVYTSFTLQGRPVYMMMHAVATYSDTLEPLRFSVTFNVPPSLQSQPVLDLMDQAHLIAHPELLTEDYLMLLHVAPRYFNVASVMTMRRDYVF